MSKEPAPSTEPFDLPLDHFPMWMINKPKLRETLKFAAHAHRFQVRKYTGEPYIFHPMSVATRLHMHFYNEGLVCPESMLQAALLHDTVEDTETTFGDIEKAFGFDVTSLVYWLTDLPMPGTNRETRKRLNAERLAFAPDAAKIIKHFDLEDNTSSIEKYDEKFAKTYLPEKARIRAFTDESMEFCETWATRGYAPATSALP